MRKPTDIVIEEVVIHILDPAGQFIPSARAIPLRANTRLHDYFTNHISTCLSTSSAKAARFQDINPDFPSGITKAMHAGETDLVSGAQKMAEQLYTLLFNDRRISPGDLAICFYSAGNYPEQRFLAMLKINPSEVFRHHIRKEDSFSYIDFGPVNQPLFAKRETLQKAAFIKTRTGESDYDMLLLDKQIPEVAEFFSQTFLKVEDAYDDRQRTDILYRSLIGSRNTVRSGLTPEQNTAVDAAIHAAISGESINVDTLIEGLPVPDEVKSHFHENVDERLPDRVFNLDRNVTARLVKWQRFHGDSGLKVEVRRDAKERIILSEKLITDDPERPEAYWEIVIHTKKWDEIK